MPELLAGAPGKMKRAECLPTRVKQAYMGLGTAWGGRLPCKEDIQVDSISTRSTIGEWERRLEHLSKTGKIYDDGGRATE